MSKRRFYDKTPVIKQAVDAFLLFPDEIQQMIADGFSEVARRDCQALELANNLKSLGAELVLALYKSKRKQRGYDRHAHAHQALNDLMVVSDENRILLANTMLDIMRLVREYLALCRDYGLIPQKDIIRAISAAYAKGGATEAATCVTTLAQTLKSRYPGLAPFPETVRSQDTGMRVKGEPLDP
jgi:hypothetical protein